MMNDEQRDAKLEELLERLPRSSSPSEVVLSQWLTDVRVFLAELSEGEGRFSDIAFFASADLSKRSAEESAPRRVLRAVVALQAMRESTGVQCAAPLPSRVSRVRALFSKLGYALDASTDLDTRLRRAGTVVAMMRCEPAIVDYVDSETIEAIERLQRRLLAELATGADPVTSQRILTELQSVAQMGPRESLPDMSSWHRSTYDQLLNKVRVRNRNGEAIRRKSVAEFSLLRGLHRDLDRLFEEGEGDPEVWEQVLSRLVV